MVAEVFAGIGAFETLFDTARSLRDMNDAVVRSAAVIELQEQILSARAQQIELIERVRELEREVAQFKTWETEKQRYKLKDFGQHTFAYELKPETANDEPEHLICPQCYQIGRKSILQFEGRHNLSKLAMYRCYSCRTQLELGSRGGSVPEHDGDWKTV
jgi:hypothetical protein